MMLAKCPGCAEMADKSVRPTGVSGLAFEGFGAADDFEDFFGDRGLAHAVCLQRQQLNHLACVVGCAGHCRHARAVLACSAFEQRLQNVCQGITGKQFREERLGIGLECVTL